MQSILTSVDLRETRQHGKPDFPLQYYVDNTREFYNSQINWHWHKEFEIVYILEGTVDCRIEQHAFTLREKDAVFINGGVLHQFSAKQYGRMPNVVFAPEFIAPADTVIYQKYVAPVDYLIRYRIMTACKLLRQTSDKISHIADCVGYENTGYFCRLFRKHTGMSPREYRNMQ